MSNMVEPYKEFYTLVLGLKKLLIFQSVDIRSRFIIIKPVIIQE
jgi:hypothetical protein